MTFPDKLGTHCRFRVFEHLASSGSLYQPLPMLSPAVMGHFMSADCKNQEKFLCQCFIFMQKRRCICVSSFLTTVYRIYGLFVLLIEHKKAPDKAYSRGYTFLQPQRMVCLCIWYDNSPHIPGKKLSPSGKSGICRSYIP